MSSLILELDSGRKGKYISHQNKVIFDILSVCVHSKFNDVDYCTMSLAWTVSLVLMHCNIYHSVIVTIPTSSSKYISWWVWWLLSMHCSVAILSQGQLLIINGLGSCSSDTTLFSSLFSVLTSKLFFTKKWSVLLTHRISSTNSSVVSELQ